jgi:hypothetical protein
VALVKEVGGQGFSNLAASNYNNFHFVLLLLKNTGKCKIYFAKQKRFSL